MNYEFHPERTESAGNGEREVPGESIGNESSFSAAADAASEPVSMDVGRTHAANHTPQEFTPSEGTAEANITSEWQVPATDTTKEAIVDVVRTYVTAGRYIPTAPEKELGDIADAHVIQLTMPGKEGEEDEAVFVSYRPQYDREANQEGVPVLDVEYGERYNPRSNVFGGGVRYTLQWHGDKLHMEQFTAMGDLSDVIAKTAEMNRMGSDASLDTVSNTISDLKVNTRHG